MGPSFNQLKPKKHRKVVPFLKLLILTNHRFGEIFSQNRRFLIICYCKETKCRHILALIQKYKLVSMWNRNRKKEPAGTTLIL